jgi:YgiT-type zinc finger domain-containing protein
MGGLISESGEHEMAAHVWKETMVDQKVTYTLLVDAKFFVIENVPARVCLETGERFFAPETVERLQQTIWGQKQPSRVIETPVYDFAA